VTIEGPFDAKGATDTASRQKIFACQPPKGATARQEERCARTIVSTLAKRAYRRPTTAADMDTLMEFYRAGRSEEGTFDDGIQAALQRILADVEFVYRGEAEPANTVAGKPYRISDLALASRLSFFIWSSIPDDELIDIAAAGKLRTPAVLEQQVRRMLKDPRASELISNFTGQWLGVRSLKTSEPIVNIFPDFDDNLRSAFEREVELFFASIVSEDRSILDLLTADYTFVNERLAKHYGIPNIYGPQFRPRHASSGAADAAWPARQGRDADGDLVRCTYVAGDARQVVPDDVPRHRAAAAAARCRHVVEDRGS
jgi:hypothetical protein